MPRVLIVVQSAVLIGDWQREVPDFGLRQPAFDSSATPSETKNTFFCGEPDVPAPGALITPLMAGMMAVKPVSWSLLSFWPLTVIRSILPAAVLALVGLEDRANSARRPGVSEE